MQLAHFATNISEIQSLSLPPKGNLFKDGIELRTNPRVVSKSNAGAVKKDESQASVNEIGEENPKYLLVFEDLADPSFFSFSSLSLFLFLLFSLALDFPACLPDQDPDPEFLPLLGDVNLDLDLDLELFLDLDRDLLFP